MERSAEPVIEFGQGSPDRPEESGPSSFPLSQAPFPSGRAAGKARTMTTDSTEDEFAERLPRDVEHMDGRNFAIGAVADDGRSSSRTENEPPPMTFPMATSST